MIVCGVFMQNETSAQLDNTTTGSDESVQLAETDDIFERSEADLSKYARSVIWSEPVGIFRLGFYLIFGTVLALGIWSCFSFINISYSLGGVVFSLDPDITALVPEDFSVLQIKASIGQALHQGDTVVVYDTVANDQRKLESPIDGMIVGMTRLQKGQVYKANTQVAIIRPDTNKTGIKLFLDPYLIGKVNVGDSLVFHFFSYNFEETEIIRGKISTVPVQEGDKYIVQAVFSEESEHYLASKSVRFIPGMPLTAEVIVGRQRLITRIMGI